LQSFQDVRGIRIQRVDPKQVDKDVCTYCQIRYGFDYYIDAAPRHQKHLKGAKECSTE
jgi:hypothetical protein